MATKTTNTVDTEATVEKPKATTRTTKAKPKEVETTTSDDVLKALMQQIEDLKRQVESQKETTGVEQLVEALTNTTSPNGTSQLPQRVKVMSLVHNTLVLSTEGGTPFTFNKFGHTITMRTSQLEDILSVPAFRRQAEEPLFYVCDPIIAEDQELTEFYEHANKDKIEYITSLSDDMCVEYLCGLGQGLINSITTSIIEDIANGKKYDRNRLDDIKKRIGIDIEAKADELIRVKSKMAQ